MSTTKTDKIGSRIKYDKIRIFQCRIKYAKYVFHNYAKNVVGYLLGFM